jgi:hypothetical protein
LKRIILLVTVGAVVAVMMVASFLAEGSAQEATGQTEICAPWSRAWDVSNGDWYYQWYRWCYDPSISDPTYESSWYTENGDWQFWDKANMCPDSGTCTMTTE